MKTLTLFLNSGYLINPNGPDHNPEDPLANMSIPIHPAAQKYWEEQGFKIPEA